MPATAQSGKGGERGPERRGEQTGGQGGRGTEKGQRRASRAEERRPTEGEWKKETVGGERSNVLGVLRRRKCRLDSELTISGTGGTEVCNQRSGECPRPIWTCAFSRRQSALRGSTPASRPDTASSLQTL